MSTDEIPSILRIFFSVDLIGSSKYHKKSRKHLNFMVEFPYLWQTLSCLSEEVL